MRQPHDTNICAELSVRDRLVADDMKAACQIDSDANLVRSALYHFAVFALGHAAVETGVFALRVGGSPRRKSVSRAKVSA